MIQVQEISEGLILPLRKTAEKSRSGIYEGGVVDRSFRFVAGLERKKGQVVNYTCLKGYEIKEEADVSEETVIFGGVFISTFGHLLAECLSRLWWVIGHREVQYKVVVLGIPGQKKIPGDFFELLGITRERIWVIEKPTRFHRIIVPEQSVRLLSDYKKEYIAVYDEICRRVTPKSIDKLYLTRREFSAQDGINEEYFEGFYGNRGYKILAPEQYSIKEQVEFMAGAKEVVVCTQGTLSHLALFCRPGTKLTVIRRAENILRQQMLIDQARQLEVSYVDATFNFMPTAHAGGVFLYGPTAHFIEYLNRNNIDYRQEETDFHIEDYVYEYLMRWCKNYNEVKNFNTISGWDIFDVIKNMNHVFGLPAISCKKYMG